jgi:hypothetical protein
METKKSCPSAPFKKGHSIFAKFDGEKMSFLKTLIKIDNEIIETETRSREKTDIRATMPCVTKECINWNGKRCTVPEQMNYFLDQLEDISLVSNCPIQKSCRWYEQDGEKACKICPLIKTKLFGT